jgi:hypothetical protein
MKKIYYEIADYGHSSVNDTAGSAFSKLDPNLDPHSPKKLDPDPHKVNEDTKHWL